MIKSWRRFHSVWRGVFLFMFFLLNGCQAEKSPTAYVDDIYLIKTASGTFISDTSRLPKASVLRVVDGDTLVIQWQGKKERLRYKGINTPERERPCYQEATDRNAVLVGDQVFLVFGQPLRDRYGRLLAYPFQMDGRSVGATLISEGLSRAWYGGGRFRDQMVDLEKEVKASKKGCLWTEK